MDKPGYHLADIEKGQLGEFQKIREEFEEAVDAFEQGSAVMLLVELSDMLGAIESYIKNKYNLKLSDLELFSDITKRAFENGRR